MEEKSPVKYLIIKQIVYLVFFVLVLIFRNELVTYLKYFISTLMLVYGIEEIIYEIVFSGKKTFYRIKTYFGLVEILIGTVLSFPSSGIESVCILWATWSIIRESFEVYEIVTELKHPLPIALSSIESFAAVVLSVILILNPTEHHALTHIYLLLVELIFTPLVPLLDHTLRKRKENV